MNVFQANVINETQKIFYKKKTFAFMIFMLLIPISAALVLAFFQNGLGIIPVNGNDFSVTILGIFTSLFLPLFICLTASDLFAGEIGDRSIKIYLTRPITRFQVYFSKVLSMGIYIALSLIGVFMVSMISGLFLESNNGFGQSLIKGLVAYGTAFAPMMLIGIVVVFISQFFKSSSGALAIAIFLFIAVKLVTFVLPGLSTMSITSYTDWYLLWIGNTVPLGKVMSVFMFILSYSIIFLASGFYFFDKKEI